MVATIVVLGLVAAVAVLLALGIDQVFSMGWQGGGGAAITSAVTFTGTGASAIDVTLASGAVTDQEEAIAIPVTGLQALEIIVTGNALATVTIQTNDGATPDDTFTFPAGGGRLFWDNTFPTEVVAPITAAVTSVFITHSAAETPRIRINANFN